MPQIDVNYLAVLVAAVANFAVGMLWYAKPLFGKAWTKLMGYDPMTPEKMAEMKKAMLPAMISGLIAAVVSAYVLTHVIGYTGATSAIEGLQAGFWMWLGFIATVQLTGALYGRKPLKLFYLDTGYQLAAMLVMG